MSKKPKIPAGVPAIAQEIPATPEPEVPEQPTVEHLEVEEEKYQLEQETVNIEAETCPRCGSPEHTPLKEISPRLKTQSGLVIRYRTTCRGRINPVDKDGKPVVDAEGKPVSYECGNRYKVKKFVSRVRKAAS